MRVNNVLTCALIGAGLSAAAQAQTTINGNVGEVGVPNHWTLAGSPYNIIGQRYVLPGATLTIDAGVIVASIPDSVTPSNNGSLAVCRGAQIFVNGTAADPVIMTSTNDTATWVNNDPKSGHWRPAANEWGNLTIMGNAYISESNCAIAANTPAPNAANRGNMEGLIVDAGLNALYPGYTQYGGGNDNDDSGSISYVSLRYGGKTVAAGVELNGLSLGGVGRNTEIDHIDIMNNLDDGIEIWGGTVNIKYFNIWNIGDDSIDIDQGFRGKIQFGLIVQGYSTGSAQGSGIGDNIFETDGAENADYQPVTTTTIYNVTAIGVPGSSGGDHGMAFRDDARVQYRNCVFMQVGERLVSNDNTDGDTPCPGGGYGLNGTLSFNQVWDTAFNAVPPHANDFTTGTYATNYPVQTSGFLSEVRDSVLYSILHATGMTTATSGAGAAPGPDVLNPVFDNVDRSASIFPANLPIVSITRGPSFPIGGTTMFMVTNVNPRPANDAVTSVNSANPVEGFWDTATYRGGFAPSTTPWICGWTACDAFDFIDCGPGTVYCSNDVAGFAVSTACPCGNAGAVQSGCRSSFNADGAHIEADGVVTSDNVVLRGSGMQATGVCVFMQGTAIDPNGYVFGDGVTCTGGSIVRLRGVALAGGTSAFPVPPETITLSQRGGVTLGSGVERSYAVFYRNAAAAFCPPATFNVSNSYRIVW